jgi:phosphohistidine phosphatase
VSDRRHLLLLRHGKSDWPQVPGADFERPLKPRGRKASERMGRWLVDENIVPDKVLCSPAVRAKTTALIATEAMGVGTDSIVWVDGIYEASVERLLYVIAEHGANARRLLVVGHNPGLEWLAASLANGLDLGANHDKAFPSAALGVLEVGASWDELAPGCATSARIIRPRALA